MGGLTPLLYAVRQGHREAVGVLLDRGADIDQVSGDKTSPLMMAVINGR
jgi:ankyrin repeat protein